MTDDRRDRDVETPADAAGGWIIRQREPALPLARDIRHVWYVEGRLLDPAQWIAPTGEPEAIINLSDDGWSYTLAGVTARAETGWFVGPTDQAIEIRPDGGSRMAGVRFHPYGAWRYLFGAAAQPMSRYAHALHPLEQSHPWLHELRAELAALPPDRVLDRLEAALVEAHARATPPDARDDALARAWMLLAEDDATVEDVAAAVGWTQRQLRDAFARRVGMGPKAAARLQRFTRVLERLYGGGYASLAEVAQDAGYFDQPHFVRDFRSFSGTTPSDYIRRGEPTWSRPHEPEAGHGRFVRGGDLDLDQ